MTPSLDTSPCDGSLRNPVTNAAVPANAPDKQFLSREECLELAQRVVGSAARGGETLLDLTTSWTGNLRWARNEILTSGDVRNNELRITRIIHGARGVSSTNYMDAAHLEATVRRAERLIIAERENPEWGLDLRDVTPSIGPYTAPVLFYDSTFRQHAAERAALMRRLVRPAAQAGMLAAGYLQVRAAGRAALGTNKVNLYFPYTEAQYSVTVRDPDGTGSGWAGVNWSDWSRVDPERLSAIALDKCLRSRNPIALEPGRYTVVLEPQAVGDFVMPLFGNERTMDLVTAINEEGRQPQPFSGRKKGETLIGQRVIDERLTLSTDPMDPDLGYFPVQMSGAYEVYRAFRPIERGVLRALAYPRYDGIRYLLKAEGLPWPSAFRLSASASDSGNEPNTSGASNGAVSVDEMVTSTERGVLVTRFTDVGMLTGPSTLCAGFTRDGLWLIERGKITRAIKNFRFIQSILASLNNVEQFGRSVRIFNPAFPVVVPALKLREFNFVSLSEAV